MVVNNDLNAALDVVENNNQGMNQAQGEAFDIYVKNGSSGNKTLFFTTAENWLVQALEGTANEIGINLTALKTNDSKHCPIYVNEETGKSTTDGNMSIGSFGIKPGKVLTIYPDGGVAAI